MSSRTSQQRTPALVNVGSGSILAGFLISYLVLAVGWVMFGVATLRAGVFRRGPLWLLIVGAVIAIVPMPSRTLILSAAGRVARNADDGR